MSRPTLTSAQNDILPRRATLPSSTHWKRIRLPLIGVVAFSMLGCGTTKSAESDATPESTAPVTTTETKKRTPPAEPWRKQKPAAGSAATLSLPTFEKVVLKNGLTVIVSTQPALPIVAANFVILAGSAHEKASAAGLAAVTYDLLDEGAGGKDAVVLSEAMQDLGTRISAGTARDAGTVAMGVLTRNLDPGLALMADIIQRPRFATDDVKRVVERRISGLTARLGNPRVQAFETFAAALYGADHAYGHSPEGTKATLSKLTPKKLKAFWKKHAGPKSGALILVGDVTLEQGKALAEKHFGSWKSKAKRPRAPKVNLKSTKTTVTVVPFPALPQTVITIGRPLMAQGDPDEAAAFVLNQLLGGMFSSRLNMNLREDKGWSYGAFSHIDPRAAAGPFLAGSNVEADKTAPAVAEILLEFARLRDEPASAAELDAAKANYIRSLPGKFETVNGIARAASSLFINSLPGDHYVQWLAKIQAVTADDVQRVSKRALAVEGLSLVLVGAPEMILEPVNALKIGPMTTKNVAKP